MDKKLEKEGFADSQSAIKGYIDYREENYSRHKVRVLIASNGKTRFNEIIYMYVSADMDKPFVLLEGNGHFERDYYDKYTIENNRFKLIRGTLLIQAKDLWGNDIEIDITGA